MHGIRIYIYIYIYIHMYVCMYISLRKHWGWDNLVNVLQTTFRIDFLWTILMCIDSNLTGFFSPIGNKPTLTQILALRWTGYMPLSEPMMAWFTNAYLSTDLADLIRLLESYLPINWLLIYIYIFICTMYMIWYPCIAIQQSRNIYVFVCIILFSIYGGCS